MSKKKQGQLILVDSDGNELDVVDWLKSQAYIETSQGKNKLKAHNPINSSLQEILKELKDLHYTIKQIHNMEI